MSCSQPISLKEGEEDFLAKGAPQLRGRFVVVVLLDECVRRDTVERKIEIARVLP